MPCYSTIRTKMDNADTLAEALRQLGYKVVADEHNIRAERGNELIKFRREVKTDAFRALFDTGNLPAIGRKYGEVGVRAWAKRKGYNIVDADDQKLTVVNRRGA